jgi:hypothetical protein
MSSIDKMIERKTAESDGFAKEYKREDARLRSEVACMKQCESGKPEPRRNTETADMPQSAITRT